MGKALVIVESPTKAKTIRKFLPKNFKVSASMGHVRDLPQSASDIPQKVKAEAWSKIGVNVEKDFEPLYVIAKGKSKIIKQLRDELKEADELYLATDEDREGESISWHLLQVLKPKIPIKRMVFHEITQHAIEQALKDCRDLDFRLVQAQEARRILDRLVGYTLSPLLWKKIAYGLSAGRVQSAGLRLIVERERERMAFKSAIYWDLLANLSKHNKKFDARLYSVDKKRVATGKDFDATTGKLIKGRDVVVLNEEQVQNLKKNLEEAKWLVSSVEEKSNTSRPSAPFITSTLQQEANRKLGLSARDTMRLAQGLYENGLITYMRTDSTLLSQEGISGARGAIEKLYGKEYLSPQVRQFKSKSKSAQEAHEAIRPVGSNFVHPKETGLSGKELQLYDLIWKRAVASQMADAKSLTVSVKITAANCEFACTGNRIVFPGFLRAYVEGSDDPESALENREVILPELKVDDSVDLHEIKSQSHETKPPARYTEASLVQTLEKEGIGRPSTYASIISTILERKYIQKQGNALVPTLTGFTVVQFLEKHFNQLVDYGFTSRMEQSLDEIASGEQESLPYLKRFYLGKEGLSTQVEEKEKSIDPESARSVEISNLSGFEVRIGRYGPYIVKVGSNSEESQLKASLPEDIAPADLSSENLEELIEQQKNGPQALGYHPKTGEPIFSLTGRYGPYVQLGEVTDDNPKPKRASIPKTINPKELTFDQALNLLSLPRELGLHPETKKPVFAGLGRFGPYVVHEKDYRSLKKEDDLFSIGLERALELLSEEKKGRRGAKLLKDLGKHPKDENPVEIYEGKFGPYIKHGRVNVSLPKDQKTEELTLEQAIDLIEKKKSKKK